MTTIYLKPGARYEVPSVSGAMTHYFIADPRKEQGMSHADMTETERRQYWQMLSQTTQDNIVRKLDDAIDEYTGRQRRMVERPFVRQPFVPPDPPGYSLTDHRLVDPRSIDRWGSPENAPAPPVKRPSRKTHPEAKTYENQELGRAIRRMIPRASDFRFAW